MAELNGLGSFFNKLANFSTKMNADKREKVNDSELLNRVTKNNDLSSLEGIDISLLTTENQERLAALIAGESVDAEAVEDEVSTTETTTTLSQTSGKAKTTFDSKQDFLDYFELDPNNDDFADKLAEAQAYMKTNGITSVTIAGKDFNVITDASKNSKNLLSGTAENDLILSTDAKTILGKDGDDFIIASGAAFISGDKGFDGVIAQANNPNLGLTVATERGDEKDFVWVANKGTDQVTIMTDREDEESNDIICTTNTEDVKGNPGSINNETDKYNYLNETGGEKELKTEFASKKEFLEFFELNPEDADFSEKIEEAQAYLAKYGIENVTIDGEEYTLYTDEDISETTGEIKTGGGNTLVLTNDAKKVFGNAGDDFIIASDVSEIFSKDGDDTLVAKNASLVDGGAGKDLAWYSDVDSANLSAETVYADFKGEGTNSLGKIAGENIYTSGEGKVYVRTSDNFYSESPTGIISKDGGLTFSNIETADNNYDELDTNKDGIVDSDEYYAKLDEELGPQNNE